MALPVPNHQGHRQGVTARSALAEPFRIALITGDTTVRSLLADRLSAATDLVVVGQADSAVEALTVLAESRPEILVIEAKFSDGDDSDVCQQFRDAGHHVGCVLLTASPRPAGDAFDGVALKQVIGQDLEQEIRRVGTGLRATRGS